MKKINVISAVLILGIFVFLGASCSNGDNTTNEPLNENINEQASNLPNTYENADWGFSIGYPEDWSKQYATEDVNSVIISFSSNDVVNANVDPDKAITIIASGIEGIETDFATHAQTVIDNIKTTETMEYISDSKTKIAGYDCYRIVYTQAVGEDTLKYLHYFFTANDKIYQILYLVKPDMYTDFESIAEEMVESFTLL